MEVLVARQAIFDRNLNVVAYELLYRPSSATGEGMRDDLLATCHVVSGTIFDIGLDRMLDGKRGLLNVPGDLLTDDRLHALPPDLIGLEVLETTAPTEECLAACKTLKGKGFLLALDDFSGQRDLLPFLELVDWVKVDYRVCKGPPPAGLGRRHPALRPKLLAEKVETEAEFEACLKAGYDLFQGYFLERPKSIAGRRISTSETARLTLLKELSKPELDMRLLEQLIERDPSLCYRLLRFANSARFALSSMVTSVRHGLVQLGEIEIRRWIALTVLPELASGRPKELLDTAVIRARMCERMADESGKRAIAQQAFLTGMFSLLEALLKRPMAELAEELKFPAPLTRALVERDGSSDLCAILSAVENYERADWDTVHEIAGRLNLSTPSVADAYVDALNWAHALQL
jgi:EAL and modified HD-GYP domain-containing signal transduction protein